MIKGKQTRPFTRLCCACQQARERQPERRRRSEEHNDEGYKIGSVPAQEEP